MRRIEVPVLVVGAGPVGAMAAILLSHRGVRSLVVERRAAVLEAPRAHVVNPRSLEICRAAGIDMDAIATRATPRADAGQVVWMTRFTGREIGRLAHERQEDDALELTPTPLVNIPQNAFEEILTAELHARPSAELRRGHQWDGGGEEGGGFLSSVTELESGRTYEVSSRYLLACDGAGSRVRKSAGIGMVGPDAVQSFVMIHFEANLREVVRDRPAMLYWNMDPEAGGVFVAHDIERTWVFMHPYDPETDAIEGFTEAVCRGIVERAIGDASVRFDVRTISTWTMTAQVAERYREGSIFLLGDAAHRFPPTGGLGMNTGIQDAHNLAWKIAAVEAGWAAPSLLDSYDAERAPVARENSEQSLANAMTLFAVIEALGIGEDPVASHETMERTLNDAQGRARVRDAIDRQREHFDMIGLQLGFCYEGGAVVPDGTPREVGTSLASDYVPSTRPGSRLPHAWLERDGRKISSLDLLSYDSFTLLCGSEGAAWAEAAAAIDDVPLVCVRVGFDVADRDGRWHELRAIGEGGAMLVRPDGHVAWRTTGMPSGPEAILRAILTRLLG